MQGFSAALSLQASSQVSVTGATWARLGTGAQHVCPVDGVFEADWVVPQMGAHQAGCGVQGVKCLGFLTTKRVGVKECTDASSGERSRCRLSLCQQKLCCCSQAVAPDFAARKDLLSLEARGFCH